MERDPRSNGMDAFILGMGPRSKGMGASFPGYGSTIQGYGCSHPGYGCGHPWVWVRSSLGMVAVIPWYGCSHPGYGCGHPWVWLQSSLGMVAVILGMGAVILGMGAVIPWYGCSHPRVWVHDPTVWVRGCAKSAHRGNRLATASRPWSPSPFSRMLTLRGVPWLNHRKPIRLGTPRLAVRAGKSRSERFRDPRGDIDFAVATKNWTSTLTNS